MIMIRDYVLMRWYYLYNSKEHRPVHGNDNTIVDASRNRLRCINQY